VSTKLGGRYQLVREIGAGGMGRVFQALDTETGRTVAAKIMIASSEDNLEALLRFQQEGAVLSTLKHPNIVEVYGTFLEEHTSCIIMELLEGQSLAQILRSEGRLPLPRVKYLAYQVASALAFAHKRAIVHRDVKPDNVMVVGNDQVKVTDFGIARILRTGATLNTATGVTIGTPLYMAPEQIEGQKVDGRADIYSFGAVLYQMVTGRPPFEGEDPLTVAFKHVHKAPQPPSEVNADVPEDWEAVILKALAKDPADRFQTAAALEEAVGTLRTGQPGEVAYPPGAVEDGKRAGDPDTIDRLIHPEITGPRGRNEPAYPSVAGDAQTLVPPTDRPAAPPMPPPVAPAMPGQTVIRPEEAPPRYEQPPSTIIRPPEPAPTMIGPAPTPPPHAATPTPASTAMPQAARPVEQLPPEERKRAVPVLPIVAGGLVALIAIAVAAFLVLNKGGNNPTPTAVPTAKPVAARPSLITAGTRNAASGNKVKLQWSPVSHASDYRLQVATRATDPSDSIVFKHPLLTKVTSHTSYSLKVLGYQYYFWRIQAQVGGKWNPYSASQHFSVAMPTVGKPVALLPRNGTRSTARQIRLCWSGVKGAANYTLRVTGWGSRRVAGTCTWISVRPGTYQWRVVARVKAAQIYTGPYSARANFTILHPAVKPRPTATPQPTAAPTAAPTQYVAPTAVPTTAPAPTAYVAPTQAPAPTAYVAPTQAPAPTPVPTSPSLCKVSC